MSGIVKSIEIDGDSFLTDGTDDTYEAPEGTPEPEDPEARLDWGRKHYGEDWYRKEVASREAARNARHAEQERERAQLQKAEEIRKLQDTEPWEYERRMGELNHALRAAAADARSKSIDSQSRVSLRPQKPTNRRTARDRTVGRAVSTLAEALVDGKRTSNMPNVKKHHKIEQPMVSIAKRTSRRLAQKPIEYGIFAARPPEPVPESLKRNPSTRKKNSADPCNHAPFKKPTSAIAAKPQGISRSSRDRTRRSRPGKKQSGG